MGVSARNIIGFNQIFSVNTSRKNSVGISLTEFFICSKLISTCV